MTEPNVPGQTPGQPPQPPGGQPAGGPPPQPYGAPPPYAPDPSGQQPNPYAPQGGYGQPPQNPYGGAYAVPSLPPDYYASWGDRVIATLWDFVYGLPAFGVVVLGSVVLIPGAIAADQDQGGLGVALLLLGSLVILAGMIWALWRMIANTIIDQGRTGYTYGKRKVGIRWIGEVQGNSPGIGLAVGKYFLHSVINQFCYIDYLWPLWDAPKRQTVTDKILSTIVLRQPDPQGESPLFGRRTA